MKLIYRFFFQVIGHWSIKGEMPDVKKYLIVVAPHTSNWDFPIGLAVRSIKGFDAKYLGKKELFRFPFGALFRKLGGYPVDRSKHTNLVDAVVELFNQNDRFIVAIAPEGTRKYVPQWKTGFYHMAMKAGIPIVFSAIDYPTKQVIFSEPFYPTGNKDEDMKKIASFFIDKRGKYPKLWPDEFYTLTGKTKPQS